MSSSKHKPKGPEAKIAVHHCTVFPGCKFKTSNPQKWKLHEVGDGHEESTKGHKGLPNDFFYCGCYLGGNYYCKMGFYKPEDYDKHQQRGHQSENLTPMRTSDEVLKAQEDLDEKYCIEGTLVGCLGKKYYCGFCKEVYACEGRAEDAEEERARHVSAHFAGAYPNEEKKTMEDWLFIPVKEYVQKAVPSQKTS